MPIRVFITVGTDHHRFDRVVDWADALASSDDSDIFVQYGTSRPPSVAKGSDYLSYDGMCDAIQAANIVVSHGGPATIMQIRDLGKLPVVVARDPATGEHVDDHRVKFVGRLAAAQKVLAVTTFEELSTISRAVALGDLDLVTTADDARVDGVVQLVGDIIDALVDVRRRNR